MKVERKKQKQILGNLGYVKNLHINVAQLMADSNEICKSSKAGQAVP